MAISFDITTPSDEKNLDTKSPTYNVRPIVLVIVIIFSVL